jgi:hypothetical protein
MSGRDPYNLLVASARKKPHLLKLLDDAKNMSIEEIKALSERKWIIKGLLAVKEMEQNAISQSIAEQLADMMIVNPTTIIEPKGDVYFMNGDSIWLGYGRSGDFKVEIKYGDLLWIKSKTNELSYEHIHMQLTIQQAHGLVPYLKFHTSDVTYKEYRKLVADKLNNDYPNAPVLIAPENQNSNGMVSAKSGGQMIFGYNPI